LPCIKIHPASQRWHIHYPCHNIKINLFIHRFIWERTGNNLSVLMCELCLL
jgi:hypothetical protein